MQTMQQPEAEDSLANVLIVDDHPLYSDALAAALVLGQGADEVRQTGTLKETFGLLDQGFDPDLIMFDLKLPDVTGISGFHALKKKAPNSRVLVISSLASVELVQSLLNAGASGFLPKDASAQKLNHAIAEIRAGRRYVPAVYAKRRAADEGDSCEISDHPAFASLTPQQVKILKLICEGKPNKQIAFELTLAETTVKAHITALLRRLRVTNRTQAVVLVDSVLDRKAGSQPEARAFLLH